MTVSGSAGSPVAIGGIGGSGTRLLAQITSRLGVKMGGPVNQESDNLFFTFLLKRPDWFLRFGSDQSVEQMIDLFLRAMTDGLAYTLTAEERLVLETLDTMHQQALQPTGVKHDTMSALLKSKGLNPRKNRFQRADRTKELRWGWKEPNTHIFLPWLAETIPDLKYIHVIRNGYDMAISANQQQACNWGCLICGSDFARNGIKATDALDYWIAANRRAIKIGQDALGQNFLLVNYEEFCADPVISIQKLAEFLEIEIGNWHLNRLSKLVSPKTIGRHIQIRQCPFSAEQIGAVAELGYYAPSDWLN